MINSYEEFLSARKSGSLKSYKVSRQGSASIDPEVVIKSRRTAKNIKAIQRAKKVFEEKA